jgi:DnaJ like chaperone protein
MLKYPTNSIVLLNRPTWQITYYHTGLLKWFFTGFGFLFLSYPGILVGFIVGSLLEMRVEHKERGPQAISDMGLSYMRLAYSVMRSDGPITEKKKQHAYRYVARHFGTDYLRSRVHVFESMQYQTLDPIIIAGQLNERIDYAAKLHLIYFLLGIAGTGSISGAGTLRLISSIADALAIKASDFLSLLAMHQPTSDRSYQILELEPSASDEEVRKAYKKLAKQHHPDKVAHMGTAYQATAKEKFQEIQHAFQEIRSKRKMS